MRARADARADVDVARASAPRRPRRRRRGAPSRAARRGCRRRRDPLERDLVVEGERPHLDGPPSPSGRSTGGSRAGSRRARPTRGPLAAGSARRSSPRSSPSMVASTASGSGVEPSNAASMRLRSSSGVLFMGASASPGSARRSARGHRRPRAGGRSGSYEARRAGGASSGASAATIRSRHCSSEIRPSTCATQSARPWIVRAVLEGTGPSRSMRAHLVERAAVEHRVRARLDPARQLVRRPVEREHRWPAPADSSLQRRSTSGRRLAPLRASSRPARRGGGRSGGSPAPRRGSTRASSACAALAPCSVVQPLAALRAWRGRRAGAAAGRRARRAGRGRCRPPGSRAGRARADSSIAACASAAYSPTAPS